MFKRVIKEKGKEVMLYIVIIAIAAFLIGATLSWFLITPETRTWEYFIEETNGLQLSLVVSGLFTLLIVVFAIYIIKRQELEAEDRVKAFAKKYKVGDQFWALSKTVYSHYDPDNPRTLLNSIFYFKVEEINLKKMYFKLSEEHRPKLNLYRIGMSDFVVYDNKKDLIAWLKSFRKSYEKKFKELNSIIEGVIND
jgi:hypothetical protein